MMMMKILGAAALLACSGTALAQDPICPDRPLKGIGTCTTPAGHIQIEIDAFDYSRFDLGGGDHAGFLIVGSTLLRYGLTKSTDVEVTFNGYNRATSKVGGIHSSLSGAGDTYLRVKQQFLPSAGPLTLAVEPYVKLPTARRGIGNRKVEEGIILPVTYTLKNGFAVFVAPEADRLADSDGDGFHANIIGTAGFGIPIGSKVNAYAELWADRNFDPAGHFTQASADVALAYRPEPSLQLDVGANFGMNALTADIQLTGGISKAF